MLTAASFLGGLVEAMFLVVVSQLAFAAVEGGDTITLVGAAETGLNTAIGVAATLVIVRLGLALLISWNQAHLATSVHASAQRDLSRTFLGSSWQAQQGDKVGALQELSSNYAGQAAGLAGAVAQFLSATTQLTAMLAIAVVVSPIGSLVMLFSVVVLGMALRPLRNRVASASYAANAAAMELASGVSETSQLGMELHVFDVSTAAKQRLESLIENTRRLSFVRSFRAGLVAPVYAAIAYVAVLGALAVITLREQSGLSQIGAVVLVMLRSLSYGQAAQSALTSAVSVIPGVEWLLRRFEQLEEGAKQPGSEPIEQIDELRLENVYFSYGGDSDALSGLHVAIGRGEIIGIVGPSGGGKSTLVKLMLGLIEPRDGAVLVNSRDIREYRREDLVRRMTFVPQVAHIISGTIEDNIRFLRSGVDKERIEKAARAAHLHEDIVRFPDGYGRMIGQGFGHLSGGQEQRLCIARALVEEPDFLILDEPTSALDVHSEFLVRETLVNLSSRMTVVIIAHRLSSIAICDRIMVIQDGELRGFDSPTELSRSNEFYREALALSGVGNLWGPNETVPRPPASLE